MLLCVCVCVCVCLCPECVERILSEEVSSVTTAAERLLQSVCELETQGWFQGFKDTLSASGTPHIGVCVCVLLQARGSCLVCLLGL